MLLRSSGARAHRRRAAVIGTALAGAAVVSLSLAGPAGACGGLVGQNGTIQLTRTTTLAAYHDGVERYVTSFDFAGEGQEVGSIVPLPDVPTTVERGGDWTLQRLEREVAPPTKNFARAANADAAASGAEVLLQTSIDALDITVLRGGGDEVGKWAVDNGFFLTPDAPQMLDFYAKRSPVFMAAKFDAKRAAARGQTAGQGTPIMVTVPTKEPWVPLRILGLGLGPTKVVEADVFLLTDAKPKLLAGGRGLSIDRSESASGSLLTDLRSDKGMGWVPDQMWFTSMKVNVAAGTLDYDLAVSAHADTLPSIEAAGIPQPEARSIVFSSPGRPLWPISLALACGGVALAAVILVGRWTRTPAAVDVGPGDTAGPVAEPRP